MKNQWSRSTATSLAFRILDWLQAILVVLAGVSLILDTYGFMEIKLIRDNLLKLIFLLICGLVITSFAERRFKLQKIEDLLIDKYGLGAKMQTLGVGNFYPHRRALPVLEDFLDNAKSDVLIVGISLYAMIGQHRDWFENKIRKEGCKFRFLLPASLPEKENLVYLADEATVADTADDLRKTFNQVVDLAQKTSGNPKGKNKVEIRVFDFVPPMGIIMLDGQARTGRIRVEIYPYAGAVDKRPSFDLIPTESGEGLYEHFRARYEDLWKNSRIYKMPNEQTNK